MSLAMPMAVNKCKRCRDNTVPSRVLGVAESFARSQPSYMYVILIDFYIFTECSDPTEQLQSHVSVSSLNGSVITFSCEPGYSLHGRTTSQCVAGEWTPRPESVTCQEDIGMS